MEDSVFRLRLEKKKKKTITGNKDTVIFKLETLKGEIESSRIVNYG